MQTGIQIVWWIGIIGALGVTIAILREVELILRTLKNINQLAEYTRDAADGIAKNVKVIPSLGNVAAPAQKIVDAAGRLTNASYAIEQKLTSLAGQVGR